MKRLLIGSATTLFLAALSPAAVADEMAATSETANSTHHIEPFNLVHGAYQGQFSNQGIPSSQRFINAYDRSQIEAKELVEAAVAKGRLPQDALQDEGYLNAVSFHLEGLSRQRDRHSN